jgi:hypothetical protein
MVPLEDKKRYSEMVRRTKSYKWADGLVEIESGLYLFLSGLFFIFWPIIALSNPLVVLLIPVFMLVLKEYIIKPIRLKFQASLILPRTGYVDYESHVPASKLKAFFMFLLTCAALVAFAYILYLFDVFIVTFGFLLLGVGFGIGWSYLGQRLALPRFYAKAALEVGLGLGLWLIFVVTGDFSQSLNISYYALILADGLIGLGMIEMGCGILGLRRYVEDNPVMVGSTEAGAEL